MQNKNPEKTGNLYSKYWGYTQIGKKWEARNRPKTPFLILYSLLLEKVTK